MNLDGILILCLFSKIIVVGSSLGPISSIVIVIYYYYYFGTRFTVLMRLLSSCEIVLKYNQKAIVYSYNIYATIILGHVFLHRLLLQLIEFQTG